jgi:cell fate regulator YaaT (PSP1 superfamily)
MGEPKECLLFLYVPRILELPRYIVRCGVMRTLHVMQSKNEYPRGAKVMARSSRGMEEGEVLREATDEVLAQMDRCETGTIQREVSAQDRIELNRIQNDADKAVDVCDRLVRESGLPMDLIDVEFIFGGERVTLYYLSEDRIDFRELVKQLAHEFQTRIEMRQVGIRDEAKLLADYGDCGKPVCCNTHLIKMPPVSMRMAKLQKPSLDPNKISGRCGRLKCCLRYEFETYEENQATMAPVGSEVVTSLGRGRVLQQEILAMQLLVEMEDRRRVLVANADILTVLKRGSGERPARPNRKDNQVNEENDPVEDG